MHAKGAYLPEIISWMNKEQWSLYVFNNFLWKETLHYKYTVGCSLVEIYDQLIKFYSYRLHQRLRQQSIIRK